MIVLTACVLKNVGERRYLFAHILDGIDGQIVIPYGLHLFA